MMYKVKDLSFSILIVNDLFYLNLLNIFRLTIGWDCLPGVTFVVILKSWTLFVPNPRSREPQESSSLEDWHWKSSGALAKSLLKCGKDRPISRALISKMRILMGQRMKNVLKSFSMIKHQDLLMICLLEKIHFFLFFFFFFFFLPHGMFLFDP